MLDPRRAPWAPMGALMGPMGPQIRHDGAVHFQNVVNSCHVDIFRLQNGEKKLRLRGRVPPGEIRAEILRKVPGSQVPNGSTATHLTAKGCDLGSLGVPDLASMVGGQTSWLARMFGL